MDGPRTVDDLSQVLSARGLKRPHAVTPLESNRGKCEKGGAADGAVLRRNVRVTRAKYARKREVVERGSDRGWRKVTNLSEAGSRRDAPTCGADARRVDHQLSDGIADLSRDLLYRQEPHIA